MTTFENPANGYRESVSGAAWLWQLLLGPVYLVYKGVWTHAVILFVFGALVLPWLLYPFMIGDILRQHYLQRGWRPVDLAAEGPPTTPPGDARSPEARWRGAAPSGGAVPKAVLATLLGIVAGGTALTGLAALAMWATGTGPAVRAEAPPPVAGPAIRPAGGEWQPIVATGVNETGTIAKDKRQKSKKNQ